MRNFSFSFCFKHLLLSVAFLGLFSSNGSAQTINVDNVDDVTCNGDGDGSISTTPSGGTGPYTYSWSNGATTDDITGLNGGVYTATLTDALLSSTTATITVNEPAVLTASISSSSDITCNGDNDGSATVVAGGGTTAYTYAWSPSGGTDATATGLSPNTYTVTVTDNNSCVETATLTITEPAVLTASISSSSDITCNGDNDGSATVVAGGGTTAYTYAWSPSGGTDATATGLSPNTYTITVTDNNSCVETATVSITEPAVLTASISSSSDITCNGDNDGSATVVAGGGTTAYTYAWSPSGGTDATATGLSPNTYTITVTDNNSCVETATVSITEPAVLTASISSSSNITCNGDNDGSATVVAGGGTTAYTYAWSPSGGTDATATGLSPNTYTITVTDNNSCVETATVSITEPAAISYTITGTNVSCNGDNDGTTMVNVTGGSGAYTYSWAPSGGTNSSATGLSPADYTVTITDGSSCVETATISITQPALLSSTIAATNVSCMGQGDGSITVGPSGGTGPYTYSWSPSGGTNASATGLSPNTYTVLVTDNNGCTTNNTASITQPSVLSLTTTTTQDVSCNSGNDGGVMVSASGGTPSYTYSWAPSGGTNSTASNLTAGGYTVTVTDNNGCTMTGSATITEPTPLSLTVTATQTVSCNSGNNGAASVNVSGGTSSYTYSWSPSGGTNATATGLTAGTYTVLVTDNNSCTSTGTTTINEPTALNITSLTSTQANCGQPDGTASVSVNGGTSPYSYSWAPSGGTTTNATGLSAGNYTITITDANSCVLNGTVTVANAAGFSISVSSYTMATCNGDCDGAIETSLSAGSSPFTYSWSNGATTSDVSGLCDGVYSVTVTDAASCISVTSHTIVEPAQLVLTASGSGSICIGQSTQLTASSTGGNGAYTYMWQPGGTTNDTLTVSPTQTTTYTLTGSDSLSCPANAVTATVTVNPALAVSINAASNSVCIGSNAILTAAASGGDGNYSYTWNPGGETTQVINVSPTVNTNYTVSVSDNCGSSPAIASFTLTIDTLPIVSFSADDTAGCDNHIVTFTNTSSPGGVAWNWEFGDGLSSSVPSPTHVFVGDGQYSVSLTVTDANGCSNTGSINNYITVYPVPIAGFSANPTTGTTETVFAFTNSSTGATSFLWNFGDAANSSDTATDPSFTYTIAGTYKVLLTATNDEGCTDTISATILVEDDLFSLFIPTAFTPNGDGINDEFGPAGLGIDPDNYHFYIYDRWGILVFYTEVWGRNWDGRVSWPLAIGKVADEPAQQDIFLWKVIARDKAGEDHEETGTVILMK